MSKAFFPSRNLLSTLSRSRRCEKSAVLISPAHGHRPGPLPRTPRTAPLSQTIHPQCLRRSFSSSSSRAAYKSVQEARSRYRSGPFSATAGLIFLSSGIGLIFYFRHEKSRMERARIAEATKGVGRPKVGGPFKLVDQDGRVFTSEDLKGRYSLVYFGFSHCPDICPEELDKMVRMMELVRKDGRVVNAKAGNGREGGGGGGMEVLPLFITCDPARDTPAVLKEYLGEFSAEIIGLTGSWEDIKAVCKAWRVYFSTPEGVKPGMDYLVDHSIYFYLMDPEGDFVEAIGRQHSPEQAAGIIASHVGDWRG